MTLALKQTAVFIFSDNVRFRREQLLGWTARRRQAGAVPHVHHVRVDHGMRAVGQRRGLLRGSGLPENADGHQRVHREPRGRRHPHGRFLHTIHVRGKFRHRMLDFRLSYVRHRGILSGNIGECRERTSFHCGE